MNDKYCQSCAMPLNKGRDIRGYNRNGTKSEKYCAYCYSGGRFIEPNITYNEMLIKGLKGIDASQGGKFRKMIFKKSYPTILKKCERWSNVK